MNLLRLNTSLAMTLVLSACGGGGGSGSATVTSTGATSGVTVTASVPSFLASTIDNSVFTHSSTEPEVQSAFTRLNTERSQCGFGALKQSTLLDLAAKNHADWQNINNYVSHSEIAGTPGFTGVSVWDRILATGYTTNDVGEGLTKHTGQTTKTGLGESELRQLFLAPYHLLTLVRGWRDVGIAIRSSLDVAASVPAVVAQLDFSYIPSTGKQLPSTTDVLTYPCQGVTGTRLALIGESPQVEAGRNYVTNPTGQPIVIMVREGNALSITSFDVMNTQTGAAVLSKLFTSVNDRNGIVRVNESMLIPDVPLVALTQYSVNVSGLNSGVAFTRSFTFTTGQ
jgi:uncharacterized protein YkwD